MTALLAAAAAAGAAALLIRPAPAPRSVSGSARSSWLPALTAVGAGLAVLVLAPGVAPVLLVLTPAVLAVVALARRQRRRRRAEAVGQRVLETCELLAAELAAGQSPGAGLDRAAETWSALAPVAESFRVGADVPTVLRELGARLDGARDLRVVAAAWEVSHRTGEGLAAAVDRVASSLRAAAATRRVVAGELASARATARLVAGLPVVALVMGSGAGADPWGFLLGTPPGLVCLAVGLTFLLAGLGWIEAIARGAEEAA